MVAVSDRGWLTGVDGSDRGAGEAGEAGACPGFSGQERRAWGILTIRCLGI